MAKKASLKAMSADALVDISKREVVELASNTVVPKQTLSRKESIRRNNEANKEPEVNVKVLEQGKFKLTLSPEQLEKRRIRREAEQAETDRIAKEAADAKAALEAAAEAARELQVFVATRSTVSILLLCVLLLLCDIFF